MKNLSKVEFVLCVFVCVLTLCACSGGGGGGGSPVATTENSGTENNFSSQTDVAPQTSSQTPQKLPKKAPVVPSNILPQITGRQIAGETITGRPDWAKDSQVFIEGRTIKIPTLWACDHEVTQGEYKLVMGNNPSTAPFDVDADKNPVNNVSWYDAIEYCNKLSSIAKLTPCYDINGTSVTCNFNADGYRLPTEAEWEYLACGGQAHKWAGSENKDDVAWHGGNSSGKTHQVKTTSKSNNFGLYDMVGNVYEWCWDVYNNIDITTPSTGSVSGSNRVSRGGCYTNLIHTVTVFDRSKGLPTYCNNDLGFRVVRTITP